MIEIGLHNQVAILIDADNIPPGYMEQILEFSEYYGEIKICRAYGEWEGPVLASRRAEIDALKPRIERIQVNRVGKNATDHRLLMDIGVILGESAGLFGPNIDVFVIASGDGDFASACEAIVNRVIGIGSKKITSNSLRESCEEFYYLEELTQELNKLKKHYPISPGEIREFFDLVFLAYIKLLENGKEWVWVSYSRLDLKLREIQPQYESKFGKYPLSELLKHFEKDFECRDQMVRRIDPNPELTRRNRILEAFFQTRRADGRASLAELGAALRKLSPDYEAQFGSKKLSAWIEMYPDKFMISDKRFVEQYWPSPSTE